MHVIKLTPGGMVFITSPAFFKEIRMNINYKNQLETAVKIIKELPNVELVAGSYNVDSSELLICIKFKEEKTDGTITEA